MRQQPDARRNCEGALVRAADGSMDWGGRLAPGVYGVRLLTLTLLCWGSTLSENAITEREEWERLARDFADVLKVLAKQAGRYEAAEAEPTTAQEGGKRKK